MATTEDKFSSFEYRLRWLYQRWLTRLPCRVRRFDDLFPPGCDYAGGVFAHRPQATTILRRDLGQPFLIQPTRYVTGSGAGLGSESAAYWSREPDRIVYAMSEAGVYGNYGRVYDPQRRAFVTETCEDWDHAFHRSHALALPGFPAPTRLPGISILLSTLGGQTFYHFLIETLPKLALLQPYLASCDRILLSRYGESWKRAWLSLWGVEHKAVFLDELSHYHCDQVLFTNRFVRHFEASPWVVNTLRAAPGLDVACQLNPQGAVLWLDRTNQPVRAVAWEDELLGSLPWVQRVRPEELTPAETARLFGQARAVLGFHGAAFSNMVFCPPGTRIIEIFVQPNYPWYARLAQSCGHAHAALLVPNDRSGLAILQAALAQAVGLGDPSTAIDRT